MKGSVLISAPLLASGVCPGMPFGTPLENRATVPHSLKYDQDLAALDMQAVEADLIELMKNSEDCWPADWGHYGPFFIRLAWHCSGTYRDTDGRGGCGGGRQRFEPERSWDDNVNLDKARALLWPIKEKYGNGLSWGDLLTFAGTTAIKNMGGPTLPFCFGRVDDEDGTKSLELGPTPVQARENPCSVQGDCQEPLGSTTVGLIYLNPEGPMGKPDPAGSAKDIRDAFGRMGMNDSQTVALIGGGHAFGKAHGACPNGPGVSPLLDARNPWPGGCGSGKGHDTFTSGFEGNWTTEATKWDNEFFRVLVDEEWEKHVGPGGHYQWRTKDRTSPYANVMRLTSDVGLTYDSEYLKICKAFAEDQGKLDVAFAEAWDRLINDGGTWSQERKCYTPVPTPPSPPSPQPVGWCGVDSDTQDNTCKSVESNSGQCMTLVENCVGLYCNANGENPDCAWCLYDTDACEAIYGDACDIGQPRCFSPGSAMDV